MRVAQHREKALAGAVGRAQRVGHVGEAVEMESAGDEHPGQETEQRPEPRIEIAPDRDSKRNEGADKRPDQRKPEGSSRQLVGVDVLEPRHRQARQELQGDDKLAQRHGCRTSTISPQSPRVPSCSRRSVTRVAGSILNAQSALMGMFVASVSAVRMEPPCATTSTSSALSASRPRAARHASGKAHPCLAVRRRGALGISIELGEQRRGAGVRAQLREGLAVPIAEVDLAPVAVDLDGDGALAPEPLGGLARTPQRRGDDARPAPAFRLALELPPALR